MRRTKSFLTVLLVTVLMVLGVSLNTLPASAAQGSLMLEYEEFDSYAVGDTIKVTMTATANEGFSSTRVQFNLNNTSAAQLCYLNLVPDSVYIDGVAADKVNTTSALTDTANKYFVNSSNRLTVTLGDFVVGDIRVVTFYVTIAEGTERLSNSGNFLSNNGSSVIASTSFGLSIPFVHKVKEAGTKTSENLTAVDGKTYIGDTVKYTVTAYNNGAGINSLWGSVTVTDELPVGVTFVPGSIEIDGVAASEGPGAGQYAYDGSSEKLTVNVGNIAKESYSAITFKATVNNDAFGTIVNTATISGMDDDRAATVTVFDESFTVESAIATYTVTYDANDGTGGYSENSLVSGSNYIVKNLSTTGITYEGYLFQGWNLEQDGQSTSYAAGDALTITDDVTLYAQWEQTSTGGNINTGSTDSGVYKPSSLAKTGDTGNVGLWIMLVCVSLGGVIMALIRKRKRNSLFKGFPLILALALIMGMVPIANVSAAENDIIENTSPVSTQSDTTSPKKENMDITILSNDGALIVDDGGINNPDTPAELGTSEAQSLGDELVEEEGVEDSIDGLVTGINAGMNTQATVQTRAVNWIVTGGTIAGVSYATLPLAITAINSNAGTEFTVVGGGGGESYNTVLSINSGKNVTIDGGGATITHTATGRHFSVSGFLTLTNIALDGGSVGGGINVLATGSLTANVGATVQNCTSSGYGGGVNVSGGGTFTMNAGTITQNVSSSGSGGGMAAESNSHFIMNGGTVVNNSVASSWDTYGGGIYIYSSSFSINGGIISDNSATYGGGVRLDSSSMVMSAGSISDNSATYGGGVCAAGSTFEMIAGSVNNNYAAQYGGGIENFISSTFTMRGGSISNNSAGDGVSQGFGGGIYEELSSKGFMYGGTISGNTSTHYGGAVALGPSYSSNPKNTFTLDGGSIQDNDATYYGGAVFIYDASSFTMASGAITENTASSGGGIFGYSTSNIIATGGTLSNNIADSDGGGIFAYTSNVVNLVGATITNNVSADSGGGLYIYSSAQATLNNCAISDNEATDGGGIYNSGSLNIQSGEISGNTAVADGGGIYNDPMELGAYANLAIAAAVSFSNNISRQAVAPPADPLTTYPTIQSSSSSVYDHPLNNDDISRTLIEVKVFYVDRSGNAIGNPTSSTYWEGLTNTFTLPTSYIPFISGYVYSEWKAGMNGSLQGDTPIQVEGVSPTTTNDLYLIYDVDESALAIDKFVGDPGDADYDFANLLASKKRPVAIGESFGWSVISSIPSNLHLSLSETYVATDALSEYFDYIDGSITVYSVPSKDTSVASAYQLDDITDYVFNYDSMTRVLSVSLTETGITKVSTRYQADGDRFLLIKYDGALNETAPGGVSLASGAEVEHTFMTLRRASSQITATVADQPEVSTGKIEVIKRGSDTGKTLPNTSFGLAETEADARAGNFVGIGVTDETGSVLFNGLLIGLPGDGPNEDSANTNFWLVETDAPEGYRVMEGALEITADFEPGVADDYYFARVSVYDDPEQPPLALETGKIIAKTGDANLIFLIIIAIVASSIVLARARRTRKS